MPSHLYTLRHTYGYVDKEFNGVSGRKDKIELCNKCTNIAYNAALVAINLIEN